MTPGEGYGWDRRAPAYWQGTDSLTRAVLPAEALSGAVERLPGIADRLRRGGRVADVGCGFGAVRRVPTDAPLNLMLELRR